MNIERGEWRRSVRVSSRHVPPGNAKAAADALHEFTTALHEELAKTPGTAKVVLFELQATTTKVGNLSGLRACWVEETGLDPEVA